MSATDTPTTARTWTAAELRRLPAHERDAILLAAAERAAVDYSSVPEPVGRRTMTTVEPTRTLDDLARLGAEVFDRHVRPSLRPADDGKFVAVDVASGEYELDPDDCAAVTRLRGRVPGAEVWLIRVGRQAACRIGATR